MLYKDDRLEKYINDAASDQPTPGGGSVSALSSALGTAMACMAANFTVGKKKFKDVEQQVKEILDDCDARRQRLLDLMQEDTEAYAAVSEAYGLPKSSDEEKAKRTEAIQSALKGAMKVPLEIVRECSSILQCVGRLVDTANPNLISDVGVAALLVESGLLAAKLNVEINLAYIKDEDLCQKTRDEIVRAADDAAEIKRDVMEKVYAKICG